MGIFTEDQIRQLIKERKNVTSRIMPLIKEWHSRPLQPIYAVVLLDAIHFKVKQEGQSTRRLVVALTFREFPEFCVNIKLEK
jgi:hypothetical protein